MLTIMAGTSVAYQVLENQDTKSLATALLGTINKRNMGMNA